MAPCEPLCVSRFMTSPARDADQQFSSIEQPQPQRCIAWARLFIRSMEAFLMLVSVRSDDFETNDAHRS